MRHYPDFNDEIDKEEVESLNAQEWQLNLLKLNPEYVFWGNYEDAMSDKNGWQSPIEFLEWKEMFGLDELNECVNFYFDIYREHTNCLGCDGTGLNWQTKEIADTFNEWQYDLTQSEVNELAYSNRLKSLVNDCIYDRKSDCWFYWKDGETHQCDVPPTLPTAEDVNKEATKSAMFHDGINRIICIEQRAKDKGVYGPCESCNGEGVVYLDDHAQVGLQLWMLHPRKGASRGVFIRNIKYNEIESVMSFLQEAANRNHQRFSKVFTEIKEDKNYATTG